MTSPLPPSPAPLASHPDALRAVGSGQASQAQPHGCAASAGGQPAEPRTAHADLATRLDQLWERCYDMAVECAEAGDVEDALHCLELAALASIRGALARGPDVGVTLGPAEVEAVHRAFDELEAYRAHARRSPSLTEIAPALERWRREILEGHGRRTPLERAAAWELTAIQAERAGDSYAADAARREARWAILRRVA